MSGQSTSDIRAHGRGRARQLDEARVVDAALEVLDRGGSGALGIRSVAAQLGVQPNAIYTYVADRASLERAVAERVLSMSDVRLLSVPGRTWRERLSDYAVDLRATLLEHPGAAGLLMTAPMDGPTAAAIGELVMGAFEEAGLSAEDGARAMYLLIVLAVGSVALDVAETDGRAPLAAERDRIAGRRQALEGVDRASLPRTAAVADVIASFIGEDQFRWALETLLAGVAQRAARSSLAVGSSRESTRAEEPLP